MIKHKGLGYVGGGIKKQVKQKIKNLKKKDNSE